MKTKTGRRSFLKKIGISGIAVAAAPVTLVQAGALSKGATEPAVDKNQGEKRIYNGAYHDEYLSRVAFPIGGIGAGMFCLEGTGAISHMSVRNKPEVFHEPGIPKQAPRTW